MAMAFLDEDLELIFSAAMAATSSTFAASTSTAVPASSGDDQGYNRNNRSPIMDWDYNFDDLVESMMRGDEATTFDHDQEACICNSTLPDTVMPETTDGEETEPDDFKGLRLIHLLVAAAEALAGANKTRELARVILARLKELVTPNDRTNMERLAAHFTYGLLGLFERAGGGAQAERRPSHGGGAHHHHDDHDRTNVMAALQSFQDMSPYINFGYLTANQAILEAVEHDRQFHIVDYNIMEGVQWASLMQAMISRKSGPVAQHLKVTALSRATGGRKSIAAIQEVGRRLIVFAESIGQPFSFHHCKLDSDDSFRSSSLKLVKGEALVINCMLHLPHYCHQTQNSVASFLSETKTLNPRLVTLVEEETGLTDDEGFVCRFMDSLYRFSAMFDSLEAGFPDTNRTRRLVERVFLGPWISGSLTWIATGYGEETKTCSLGQWLGTNRFKPVGISYTNHCQAKLLLGLFNDGYGLEGVGVNRLVLDWKSRRLVSASLWTSPEPHM